MRHFLAKNHADLFALLLITLTVAVFFAPVWLSGGWLPHGGGDLVSFLWPTYTFAARSIPGDLPLWNPHQYGGAPFWADNQSGILYPPNLLLFLLTDAPPYQALEALVMLHIWGAGVAMYAALRLIRREQRFGPAAALTGAIIYMLSDVFITHQGNLNLIAVAAWLPLVFLGTWNALAHQNWVNTHIGKGLACQTPTLPFKIFNRWSILAGVAFGIGTLAGHAQMTYFTLLVIGAAGVWWLGAALITGQSTSARLTNALTLIGTLAVIGVIAFGLSAAALLPTLEMTGYTARAELSYTEAARYSLPPQALGGLLDPRIFGRGPAHFTGSWDRVEVGYVGVAGLLLSLAGALTGIRRRDGLAIFLMLGAVVAFLLALGENCLLHRLLYAVLPGMRSIRVPARFVLLMNFAQAGLAAVAIQTLLGSTAYHHQQEKEKYLPTASLPARILVNLGWVLPLWIWTRLSPTGSKPVAKLSTAWKPLKGLDSSQNSPFRDFQTVNLAWSFEPQVAAISSPNKPNRSTTIPPAGRGPGGGVEQRQEQPTSSHRFRRYGAYALIALVALELVLAGSGVEVQADDPRVGYDHATTLDWLQTQPDPPFRIEGAPPLWQPDSAALYGGQLFDSYGISNPLALAAYDAFYWSVGQRGSPTYNALGVKYVIAGDEPPGDATFVPVHAAENGVTVYLNTTAQPLVHLVYEAVPVTSPEAAWEAVHAPDWDISQTVYVEGGPALDIAPPDGAGLFFTVYDPNALAVVVNTPEPAYLVLSEVWYPGWGATIDGQPAPIYRANTVFRAVYIAEPGEHTILLTFRPLTVIVGLGITAVTVLGLISGGLLVWQKQKRS